MNFENPLLLLLLVPLAGGVFFSKLRAHWKGFAHWFLIASLVCLVIAAANPYWKTVPGQKLSREANFIFILDVSQSMFCREGSITRIEEATSLLKALLPQLSGTSISIVYFAGDAQLGTPSTEDATAVRLFLDSIVPKMSAQAGTKAQPIQEVLSQITTADSALAENQRKQVALLFSDGEFSDSVEALKQWLKRNKNVTLFTFATGTAKAEVPEYNLSRPHPGAMSEPRRKELAELGAAGRGKMFSLSDSTNPSAVLTALTTSVRQIVSTGDSVPLYEEYPFLIAALILLLIYQAFPLFAGLKFPRWEIATALLVLITMGMTAQEKQATFSDALKAIEQKQYKKAIAELEKLEAEAPNAETEIAIGNAYFYQQQFDTAIEHYKRALKDDSKSEMARWNWEVALKRKSNPNSPPPPQPPPPSAQKPQEVPQESQALLKYSDQLERNQLKELNAQNSTSSIFEW